MTRHIGIDIDAALLRRAQEALRTRDPKETVEKALREAVGRHLRRRLIQRVKSGEGVDRSPRLLRETRTPR